LSDSLGNSADNINPGKKFLDVKDILLLCLIASIFLSLVLPGLTRIETLYGEEHHYVPAASHYIHGGMEEHVMHPPLAKILISVFMRIFGDNPLGWRAGSVVFGLLSVLLAYLFGLALFEDRVGAVAASLLLAMDFLHIVQSRIAMLDIYNTFFLLAWIYCAFLYVRKSQENCNLPLINRWTTAGAVFMGLSLSSKLNGISGFFISISYYAVIFTIREKFIPFRKIAKLALFYLVVISGIYLIAHIPDFLKGAPLGQLVYPKTLELHYTMKFEHLRLVPMWKWPLLLRPFLYYFVNNEASKTYGTIIGWGSFLFWWGFIPIFIYQVYRAVKFKSENIILIVMGYLGLYLFWLLSFQLRDGRFYLKGGFIYYMITCVPFMAFTVADVIRDAWKTSPGRFGVLVYMSGIVYFLQRFYPLLTGEVRPYRYFDRLYDLNVGVMIAVVAVLTFMLFIFKIPGLEKKKVEIMDEKDSIVGEM
jgi:dolichyl-phosphate-mannose-protein mannosyltransferase